LLFFLLLFTNNEDNWYFWCLLPFMYTWKKFGLFLQQDAFFLK
jgi:hypothetical protein